MRKERLRREAAFLDRFGVQVAREEERGAGVKIPSFTEGVQSGLDVVMLVAAALLAIPACVIGAPLYLLGALLGPTAEKVSDWLFQ